MTAQARRRPSAPSCLAKLAFAALGAALCVNAASCRRAPTPEPRRARLAEGVVAQVGDQAVSSETVIRIAQAQSLTADSALSRALADARVAIESERRAPPLRSTLERAALARAVLESLGRDAAAKGTATDTEIRDIRAERWVDLDRPAMVRVSHAVALRPKSGDPGDARKVAERILDAVAAIRDAQAFLTAARAVPSGSIRVQAERLPYIASDGRSMTIETPHEPMGTFDLDFARAANALAEPGDHSGIVETQFGFHVILLEEKLPPQHVSMANLRAILQSEVLSRRAQRARDELVQRLSAGTSVQVARDADAVTRELLR